MHRHSALLYFLLGTAAAAAAGGASQKAEDTLADSIEAMTQGVALDEDSGDGPPLRRLTVPGDSWDGIEWSEDLTSWEAYMTKPSGAAFVAEPQSKRGEPRKWAAVWGLDSEVEAREKAIAELLALGSTGGVQVLDGYTLQKGDWVEFRAAVLEEEEGAALAPQATATAAGLTKLPPTVAGRGVVVKTIDRNLVRVQFPDSEVFSYPSALLTRVGPWEKGDRVVVKERGKMTHADAWKLFADEEATVEEVDEDGDVKLKNPRGDISKWMYSTYYTRAESKASPADAGLVVGAVPPIPDGVWYMMAALGEELEWQRVELEASGTGHLLRAGSGAEVSTPTPLRYGVWVRGTITTPTGSEAGRSEETDNSNLVEPAKVLWKNGTITVQMASGDVALYRGLPQAACKRKLFKYWQLRKHHVLPAGNDLLTKPSEMAMPLSEALGQCELTPECRAVCYEGDFPVVESGDSKVYKYLKTRADPRPHADWTSFIKNFREKTVCTRDDDTDKFRELITGALKSVTDAVTPPSVTELASLRQAGEDTPRYCAAVESAYRAGKAAFFAEGDELRNVTLAAEKFQEAAEEGHADAHFYLGLMRTLGLGVNASETLALLHYQIAARGGNANAAYAIANRHKHGYGMRQKCEEALPLARIGAEKLVREYFAGTLAGVAFEAEHLTNARVVKTRAERDHHVRYSEYAADGGNYEAQLRTASGYLMGGPLYERSLDKAEYFLEQAMVQEKAEAGDSPLYGRCGLGALKLARAEKQDIARARELLEFHPDVLSSKAEDSRPGASVCLETLGYMVFNGIGGFQKSLLKAHGLFQRALVSSNFKAGANTHYNYGVSAWLGVKSPGVALPSLGPQYLASAAVELHFVPALFLQGALHHERMPGGTGQSGKEQSGGWSCEQGLKLFQEVAERTVWGELADDARRDYADGDIETALLKYLVLAEQGFEPGQSNAAFIFNEGAPLEDLPFAVNPFHISQDSPFNFDPESDLEEFTRRSLALKYYRQAASQFSVDAMVSVGDYYYYGMGTDQDMRQAVQHYQQASLKGNDRATFNLGYMHEHGVGVSQDLHLAKRYYDSARRLQQDAAWAVNLALIKLTIHSWIIDYFIPQANVTTLATPGNPPLCPGNWMSSATLATCCDPDGSCADGTDLWCCKGKAYCSRVKKRSLSVNVQTCPADQLTVLGIKAEDFALGTALLVLFVLLFIKHTARQIHAQQAVPPVAPVAAAPDAPRPEGDAAPEQPAEAQPPQPQEGEQPQPQAEAAAPPSPGRPQGAE
eukprot:Hpha_TRINITY_DN14675_c0_g1::TRINITY_DN14675_c0_g1_i1::g.48212::m.48212/K14026/SEL1, SEL1L; SEL1 protein